MCHPVEHNQISVLKSSMIGPDVLPYLGILVVQQIDEVGHRRGLLDHEAARRGVRAHEVKHVDNLGQN